MTQPICQSCGTPLPAGSPGGLCPRCLLKRGMEAHTAGFTAPEAPRPRWQPPAIEELGGQFPELEITELLGRGGMGAVYKARQRNLDRVVALKILPPEMGNDPAFAERFAREAQAMARLNHPHIVTLHEFGQRGNLFFFIMEYVDGMNLRGLLDSGHVSPKEALAIVPQICEALAYAHDQGIVHRDIKPENILLNKQGQVKIADFGLAKLMGRTRGQGPRTEPHVTPGESTAASPPPPVLVTSPAGTPQYMAPEQMDRPAEVDHRADIYSLGVVFYQMLTGELPAQLLEPPSRKVLIDVRLDQIVLRALEKSPELRYQNATEFKTEVETVIATPPHVPASSPPLPGVPPAKSEPALQDRLARAQQDLKIPAIGLRLAAFLNLLLILGAVGAFAVYRVAIYVPPQRGSGSVFGSDAIILIFAGLLVNLFILRRAVNMAQCRNYAGAVAAAILAMFAFPANIIGLPMGIWALIVLNHRDIKDAFDAAKTSTPTTASFPPRATTKGHKLSLTATLAAPLLWVAPFIPTEHMYWMAGDPQEWVTFWGFRRAVSCIMIAVGGLFLILPLLRSRYAAMAQLVAGSGFLMYFVLLWIVDPPHSPYAHLIVAAATLLQIGSGFLTIYRAWPAAKAQFDSAGTSAPPAPPKPNPAALLLTVGIHLAAMIAVFCFFVVAVPHFAAIFAQFGGNLPAVTQWTLDITFLLQRGWFLAIPLAMLFLAADAAICWALDRAGLKALRRIWSILVLLGLGAVVLFGVWSINVTMPSLYLHLAPPTPETVPSPETGGASAPLGQSKRGVGTTALPLVSPTLF